MSAPVSAPIIDSSSSLYVGDLLPSVDETKLYSVFETIGHITSIKICRDKITQESLGYAYVNYETSEDVDRALSALNFSLIDGKPCRLMREQRDASLRKSGEGNVFVKNLPKDVDSKTLLDMFSVFGKVVSCKVSSNVQTGESLGYGYVQFENNEGVDKAITTLNGKVLKEGSAPLIVEIYKPKSTGADWTNTYIKNFPYSWTEDNLKELLKPYGTITSIIVTDIQGSKFACANFDTHEHAVQAIEALHNKPLPGSPEYQPFYIQKHQTKQERIQAAYTVVNNPKSVSEDDTQQRNLYVKNINPDVTDQELLEYFSQCGKVVSATINRADGVSKGFGFVSFATNEEANKAIVELHGKIFHSKPLYVAVHQPKNIRQAQLNAMFARPMVPNPMASNMYSYYYNYPRQPVVMPNMQNIPNVQNMQNMQNMMPNNPYYNPYVQPMQNTNNKRFNNRRYNNNNYRNSRDYPIMNNMMPHMQQNNAAEYISAPLVNMKQNNHMNIPVTSPVVAPVASPIVAPISAPATASTEFNKFSEVVRSIPAIDKNSFMALSPEEQRNNLGDYIYHCIEVIDVQKAAKITGMMLEFKHEDLLALLTNPKEFYDKIQEAISVLNQSN